MAEGNRPASSVDGHEAVPSHTTALPARRPDRFSPHRNIVVEEPGFAELTDADRRGAVAVVAELLAQWWRRQANEVESPHG
jgi:hypothetical protein